MVYDECFCCATVCMCISEHMSYRTSINRSAEAMTIFAVLCAASFILAHMGRPWLAHWALPLPNAFGSLWVNFNSPLVWDVFAISTYLSVSLLFWYMGLVPDLATIRDRATYRDWETDRKSTRLNSSHRL